MRIHIQRVSEAAVSIDNQEISHINSGLLLFVAAHKNDTEDVLIKLAEKCINLRIFEDQNSKMNLSVKDINGSILVISNFTLYADCKKGNRPNFMEAAPSVLAEKTYTRFVEILKASSVPVFTGKFGAMMKIHSINDGPVTLLLEM